MVFPKVAQPKASPGLFRDYNVSQLPRELPKEVPREGVCGLLLRPTATAILPEGL